jgi:hypothetical protein
VAITVQLPAPDDLNVVAEGKVQPAVPALETLNEYEPDPVPPEALNEIFVLNVPEVDVSVTNACVALPMVTVVATELATK